MNPLGGVNETQADVDGEQKAVDELKALFQPAGGASQAGVATRVKSAGKPAYFDRFRAKLKVYLN